MPLRFPNSAAEVFFWLFFAAACLCALAEAVLWVLPLAFQGKRSFRPAAEIFLGAAIACLAPQYPFVYSALFLLALGDGLALLNGKPRACAAVPCLAAQCLFYACTAKIFLEPLPWYAHFLFALLPLAAGASVLFFSRKNIRRAFSAAAVAVWLCLALFNVFFAAEALFDEIYFYEIVILAGQVLFTAARLLDRFASLPRVASAALALFSLIALILICFGYPLVFEELI